MARPTKSAERHQHLQQHVAKVAQCARCPRMHRPAVANHPVVSPVILVGQAPGNREPEQQRMFAWTAGRTLFQWFEEQADMPEERFRRTIYITATCRCFPGKNPQGGDRVPARDEIANCAAWLEAEFQILRPRLVISVGKLAMRQFLPEAATQKLDALVGRIFHTEKYSVKLDIVPLPHPSGASPWPRTEPGITLLGKAMRLIREHEAFRGLPA